MSALNDECRELLRQMHGDRRSSEQRLRTGVHDMLVLVNRLADCLGRACDRIDYLETELFEVREELARRER